MYVSAMWKEEYTYVLKTKIMVFSEWTKHSLGVGPFLTSRCGEPGHEEWCV